jgi:hypothetical protein
LLPAFRIFLLVRGHGLVFARAIKGMGVLRIRKGISRRNCRSTTGLFGSAAKADIPYSAEHPD